MKNIAAAAQRKLHIFLLPLPSSASTPLHRPLPSSVPPPSPSSEALCAAMPASCFPRRPPRNVLLLTLPPLILVMLLAFSLQAVSAQELQDEQQPDDLETSLLSDIDIAAAAGSISSFESEEGSLFIPQTEWRFPISSEAADALAAAVAAQRDIKEVPFAAHACPQPAKNCNILPAGVIVRCCSCCSLRTSRHRLLPQPPRSPTRARPRLQVRPSLPP